MPIAFVGTVAFLAFMNKRLSEDTWTKSFWMAFSATMLLSLILGVVLSRPSEQFAKALLLFPGVINFSMIVMVSVFSSIFLRIRGADEEIEDTAEWELRDCLLTMPRRILIITCIWIIVAAIITSG